MKKIKIIILSILCLLGFNISVDAYTNSNITANRTGDKYEYVSGLPVYLNTANGYNLYVLDYNTYYSTSTILTDPTTANNGITYIVNNSNVTSSSYKNYYIAQVSILWYQDYINGNDFNISSSMKNTIKNTTGDTVCYYINKLVNNAINYNNNTSIKFLDKNISFTRNGNYYYSNVINVETYNLNSTPSVKLYNAPSNSDIINNTITNNGTGSFQIRIPASTMNSINEKDFEVYITGYNNNNTIYQYTNYGSNPVIYARTYSNNSTNAEASLPVHIKGNDRTNIRINILDNNGDYIKNLTYYIYNGDCTNSTCYSDNLITTFTTTNNYTTLNNILNEGVYTLVNKSNNNNYNLPPKTKFNVKNITSLQEINISENDDNNNNNNNNQEDSLRKIMIYNKFNDSHNEIKIYTNSNYLQESYQSTDANHEVYLSEGIYYIVDTKNKIEKLYFKITEDGRLQVNYNNNYVYCDYITLDRNDYNDSLSNNDDVIYDEESNTYYVDGLDDITIEQTVDTEIEWLNDLIDCPITSLSETIKYVIGASIIALGSYLLIKNVKKTKNNN